MRLPSPAHGLVVLHCLVAASAAPAQPLPGPPMAAEAPAGLPAGAMPHHAAHASPHAQGHAPATAEPRQSTAPSGLGYRSAFDGYVPFADGPPGSWTQANDTVRRRGGWKAYAAEAQGDAAATVPGPAPARGRP